MTEENSGNSTKRLVKILVMVGIGIPVLVELMTLFNLLNVQIFGDEKDSNSFDTNITEVRGVGEGDTLFAEQGSKLTIDQLRVEVSTQQWRFTISMTAVDSISQDELQISVDSLNLQSNKTLLGSESRSWEVRQTAPAKVHGEWILPNGDIPTKLYVSIYHQAGEDSTYQLNQEVPLNKVPVRYSKD